MQKTALVVGISGMIGGNAARELLDNGWTVYGLSRNPTNDTAIAGVRPVAADLLDARSVDAALKDVAPTHVFFATWTRRPTEAENIQVNSAMVRNVLDALSPKKCVEHVELVTGLKHYLGPFDAYVSGGFRPQTPLREEQPRLDLPNFYYAQEDEVYAAARRDGFTWTVQRPHTVIGKAIGNAMNMGSTLAVYASICKETGRKFRWPGSEGQWNGICDVTDARVLARHLVWAATAPGARNEAFNVVNGDYFRWSWLWPRIADWFGVESVGWDGTIHPLEAEMADAPAVWAGMVAKYGLKEADLDRLASAWHTDLDLGRPIEIMTDMTKSREAGFLVFQSTEKSFTDLFAQLRQERLIP
ncbi:SDR family oxidoreductase [Kumtagia ephedrae]|uniref:NAD-dependent dehydratase n=1 Tax=Kumtagia ephedrae TaxID=2116701 RepID=A0A2P7SSB4_9HYPH|nr:SDR family oxidoreductase [Mesorhizobium ephedrae]PSJ65337.1 NAD-dependent dehydratase [Mesorhizobium ephedrae]